MEKIFDTLIDGFIADRIGIADNFITPQLAANLSDHLNALYARKQLRSAGTGNDLVVHNKVFRSDVIYWLDRKHEEIHENNFFDLADQFVSHLNSTCYTGITSYEFHYALYQEGTFYKKHLDQFRNDQGRQYSLVIYLNQNWQPVDGGELCIHGSEGMQKIAPTSGKAVFFKSSELEHEVLVTNKPRLSIVGWLKKDPG